MKLIAWLLLATTFQVYGADQEFAAVLFFKKGKVTLSSDGGLFGSVDKGETLAEGDVIKTGEKSLAIIRFPDKSTMRVDQNSEIEIEKIVERVEGESLGSSDIILKAGRTVIDVINKSKSPIFNVRTRSVAVGVRGTRFMAGLDPESNHMDLAVDRGEVEIAHREKEGVADAIEAGHSIHLENGSEFNQPQKHDWIKDFNFKADDTNVDHSKLSKVMELKRLEHRQKRAAWIRDPAKWAKKVKDWSRLKSSHLSKANLLKSKRLEFLKKKKNFLKDRKKIFLKREGILKESGALKKKIKKLKLDKAKYQKDVQAFRSGRKDPRKMKELLKRKKRLGQREKNLKSSVQKVVGKKSSLRSQKKELLKKDFGGEIAKKIASKKKVFKELKKRRPKRPKKKDLIRKGAKKLGLPGGLFGN